MARLDDAYIYLFPIGGFFGLHHFYLRNLVWGRIYFITIAMCGLMCVLDLFRLYWLVKDYNTAVKEGRPPGDNGRYVVITGNGGHVITHNDITRTTLHTHIIQRTPAQGANVVQGQVLPQSQTIRNISEHDALLQPSQWGNTPRYTT